MIQSNSSKKKIAEEVKRNKNISPEVEICNWKKKKKKKWRRKVGKNYSWTIKKDFNNAA